MIASGVGEYKYEKYGERFVKKIKDFTGGVKEKYCFYPQHPATQSALYSPN